MSFRDDHFEQMNRLFEQMRRTMWGAPGMGGPGFGGPMWDASAFGNAPAFGESRPESSDESMSGRRPRSRWSGMERFGVETNVTVEQTDDGFVVMADLPGFEKDDLSIRFEDGVLTIDGESEVAEEREGGSRRRSRRVHEQLSFPSSVVEDEISASYHNGVLEIALPRAEGVEDDSHHIDIE